MAVIARRTYPFDGEVSESAYEAGRYFVAGTEISESLRTMQRDVLAFVSDTDQLVTVSVRIEVGPQDAVEQVGVSGVSQYVGVPLRNTITDKAAAGIREETVELTGKVVEVGIGNYYVVQANGKEENFSAKAMQALHRAIDDYSKSRIFITCILDVEVAEATEGPERGFGGLDTRSTTLGMEERIMLWAQPGVNVIGPEKVKSVCDLACDHAAISPGISPGAGSNEIVECNH